MRRFFDGIFSPSFRRGDTAATFIASHDGLILSIFCLQCFLRLPHSICGIYKSMISPIKCNARPLLSSRRAMHAPALIKMPAYFSVSRRASRRRRASTMNFILICLRFATFTPHASHFRDGLLMPLKCHRAFHTPASASLARHLPCILALRFCGMISWHYAKCCVGLISLGRAQISADMQVPLLDAFY